MTGFARTWRLGRMRAAGRMVGVRRSLSRLDGLGVDSGGLGLGLVLHGGGLMSRLRRLLLTRLHGLRLGLGARRLFRLALRRSLRRRLFGSRLRLIAGGGGGQPLGDGLIRLLLPQLGLG
jgi:hypothetical protein